ncbi:hypothetical protein MN608_08003 [Microdochium nivale]|nr:hypothetical protein MN608_08003 [Microdochium nivale]
MRAARCQGLQITDSMPLSQNKQCDGPRSCRSQLALKVHSNFATAALQTPKQQSSCGGRVWRKVTHRHRQRGWDGLFCMANDSTTIWVTAKQPLAQPQGASQSDEFRLVGAVCRRAARLLKTLISSVSPQPNAHNNIFP